MAKEGRAESGGEERRWKRETTREEERPGLEDRTTWIGKVRSSARERERAREREVYSRRERTKEKRGRNRDRLREIEKERERERELHPCAAVAVAVAETEPALVIYINPIIAWRFPN